MKNSIYSYSSGNGLVVWRPGSEETIAFISPTREIKYRQKVSALEKKKIEKLAATDNRTISVSQDQRVFSVPPIKGYNGR